MAKRRLEGPISKLLDEREWQDPKARLEVLDVVMDRLRAVGDMFETEGWKHYELELRYTTEMDPDFFRRHNLWDPEGQKDVIAELQWRSALHTVIEETKQKLTESLQEAIEEHRQITEEIRDG